MGRQPFQGRDAGARDVVAVESGDLAYPVGFERGGVVVDGGSSVDMTIRVTHIYRRLEGKWRLVHRHADFPPADQRHGSGGERRESSA
jgi:ketosteroid isomerase-like protein